MGSHAQNAHSFSQHRRERPSSAPGAAPPSTPAERERHPGAPRFSGRSHASVLLSPPRPANGGNRPTRCRRAQRPFRSSAGPRATAPLRVPAPDHEAGPAGGGRWSGRCGPARRAGACAAAAAGPCHRARGCSRCSRPGRGRRAPAVGGLRRGAERFATTGWSQSLLEMCDVCCCVAMS